LLEFTGLSDESKLKKLALGWGSVDPVNSCKNEKQLRPYSQRHIFGFKRGSSLLQSAVFIR
jgi:hypothetical protein